MTPATPNARTGGLLRWGRALATWLYIGAAASSGAQEISAPALAARQEALAPRLAAGPLGLPLVIESSGDGGRTLGEIHALLDQTFDLVVSQLRTPSHWCRVLVLQLNVKGCLHDPLVNSDTITVLSGRKGYESPGSAQVLRFAFRVVAADSGLLHVELAAPSGPLGTSDYRITLAAVPAPQGSFVKLAYGYDTSMLSRAATSAYLATGGLDKVGFSTVGTGADGRPIPVSGARGIVERNAVRYYLAIRADLESPAQPGTAPTEATFRRWFDLTERWPRQLHELDWSTYIDGKRRERAELPSIGGARPSRPR